MDLHSTRPYFPTTYTGLNHTGLKRKITNPRRGNSCTAIPHAFDRSRFSSLAISTRNLMGLLHTKPALHEIPRDFRTDNIPNHKIRKKERRSGHEKEEKVGRAVSPESVETEPAIISASIIREAPVVRARASTSHSETSLRAVSQKELPHREHGILYSFERELARGRIRGVRSHVSTIECIERCQ